MYHVRTYDLFYFLHTHLNLVLLFTYDMYVRKYVEDHLEQRYQQQERKQTQKEKVFENHSLRTSTHVQRQRVPYYLNSFKSFRTYLALRGENSYGIRPRFSNESMVINIHTSAKTTVPQQFSQSHVLP